MLGLAPPVPPKHRLRRPSTSTRVLGELSVRDGSMGPTCISADLIRWLIFSIDKMINVYIGVFSAEILKEFRMKSEITHV